MQMLECFKILAEHRLPDINSLKLDNWIIFNESCDDGIQIKLSGCLLA